MKTPCLLLALLAVAALAACSKSKEDPTASTDWQPENASVARHITSVHQFVISPDDDAHLRVEKDGNRIVATLREDVLEELGGEKALYILGWIQNPEEISRHEYLFFLEALHAYLVLYAPKWDGGEGPASAATAGL